MPKPKTSQFGFSATTCNTLDHMFMFYCKRNDRAACVCSRPNTKGFTLATYRDSVGSVREPALSLYWSSSNLSFSISSASWDWTKQIIIIINELECFLCALGTIENYVKLVKHLNIKKVYDAKVLQDNFPFHCYYFFWLKSRQLL